MPAWSVVTRPHVLAALKEYDDLGDREFLRRYGYRRDLTSTLWHDGKEHDAKAVLGVAYYHATGTPARPDELSDTEEGAVKVLTSLGFDVVVDEEALAKKPRRSRTVKPKPAAAREATPKVCPTCHIALPASGICDFCD